MNSINDIEYSDFNNKNTLEYDIHNDTNIDIDIENFLNSKDTNALDNFLKSDNINEKDKASFTPEEKVEIHNQCLNDPYMSIPQMNALKYDMLINGQQVPVKVNTKDGKYTLIDGKNRLKALQELGMDTHFEIVDIAEKDIYSYRRSLNKFRTKYSKSQLACYAAEEKESLIKKNRVLLSKKMKDIKKGEFIKIDENIDTNKCLALTWGVNHDYIAKATEIRNKNKAEFEFIKKGEKKLLHSYNELFKDKQAKEEITPEELIVNYENIAGNKLSELEKNYIDFLSSSIMTRERAIETVIKKLKQEYNDFKPELLSDNQKYKKLIDEFLDFYKKEYDESKYKTLEKLLKDKKLLKIGNKEKISFEGKIEELMKVLDDQEKEKVSRIISLNEEKVKRPIPEEKSLYGNIRYFIKNNYPYAIGENFGLDIYNSIAQVSKDRSLTFQDVLEDIMKNHKDSQHAN
jgi:ParB-like chromosome segregation protein Spo0J